MAMGKRFAKGMLAGIPPRRVLVSIYIGVAAAREVFSGIVSRINANHPWVIDYEFDRAKAFSMLKENPGRYAGMIAEAPGSDEEFAELAALGIPIVFTKNIIEGKASAGRISCVRPDDAEIGREAFRQLARLGKFGTWVFAPDSHGRRFSRLRGKGFAEAVVKRFPDAKVAVLGDALEQLKALPRPLAIFAVNDNNALNVLGLCRLAGIKVPGQAMVLGCDNDPMVCLNSKPTLSSIHPGHFVLGERAVDELARLMKGGAGRTLTVKIPVKEVVKRESTRYLPPAEHLVREALKYIGENADRALSVGEVAAHLRVSRPLLDLRFREIRGASVGAAIAEARLAEVKRRLAGTRETATQIAADCGFGNVAALSRFFKRESGENLRAARAARQSTR